MTDDYRYFKFRAINMRLVESLVNRSLYFAKPVSLNDPFDCRLDLRKSMKRAAASASGARRVMFAAALSNGGLIELWQRQFENLGVCAFSLDPHDTLLWSHYGEDHRGACLLYRFTEKYLVDPQNEILGVDTIKYRQDALFEWLCTCPIEPNGTDQFVEELTKVYLTVKSMAWEHEKEARIIRFKDGIFTVPHGGLEQVCFGLRTPPRDVELITRLAADYSGCAKFCRMVHDESDFGFEMREL